MGERFFHRLWQGTAPLVLWAAHFFFCYLYAAAGCRRESWAVLLGVTLLALVLAGWLVWAGWRHGGRPRSLLHMAQRGGALLALVAIGWSALPLLVFGGCA
jgi:hypothetical protein